MDKIVFLETPETVVMGSVENVNEHVCKITFEDVPEEKILLSGFYIANDYNDANMTGEYFYGFKTIWRNMSPVIYLSNDGSIYEPPMEDIKTVVVWNDNNDEDGLRPTSIKLSLVNGDKVLETATVSAKDEWTHDWGNFETPNKLIVKASTVKGYSGSEGKLSIMEYHESLSQVKNSKFAELDSQCNQMIQSDVEVPLSTGTQIFNFTELVQRDLANAYSSATALLQVGHPEIQIPFYNNEGVCSLYLPNDVMAIYMALGTIKTSALTLLHQLEDQISKMTDVEKIKAIQLNVESLDDDHKVEYQVQMNAAAEVIKVITGEITEK